MILAGDEITLPCDVSGDPRPTIRWRKDLEEIDFYATDHSYLKEESGSLFIPQASVQDAGTYMCSAENSAGFVTKEIELVVYGKAAVVMGFH